MINSLTGILTGKGAGRFYLETSGLEWEIESSYTTISALPAEGGCVKVFTYLYHREDSMRLFGFFSEEERFLFLDLMKVNGIGPKQALRILSSTNVEFFSRILEDGDAAALSRIPGLGVKTAQKIILALKGKLTFREETGQTEQSGDLVLALEDMGFDRKKAATVIKALTDELGAEGLVGAELEKECFRQAIIRLSAS
ncbi:MAG: Holliday junction branch migration protein RuvA [Spirochaetales bacterium]|jgi:Holliday junction DNA helicase RuvA|nr:Holliday junction branch migration protein RuvA [Spirochaetales bacterium]